MAFSLSSSRVKALLISRAYASRGDSTSYCRQTGSADPA
jgi:hypothetical protein